MVLTIAGQHDASISQARHGIEMNPTFYLTHYDLGMALWAQGKTEEALAAFRTSRSHAGSVPVIEGSLGWALGRAGHEDEARAVAGELTGKRVVRQVIAQHARLRRSMLVWAIQTPRASGLIAPTRSVTGSSFSSGSGPGSNTSAPTPASKPSSAA